MPSAPQNPTGDVYLAANVKHLYLAMADALARPGRHLVIYLSDYVDLPGAVFADLAEAFPRVEILRMTDAGAARRFAGRADAPGMIGRNLRREGLRVIRPWGWAPEALRGRRFARGHIYHTGFFLAKVLRGMCDDLILREDGLSNYHIFKPTPVKGAARLLFGQSARHKVIGDEPWVDHVELARPKDAPRPIAHKTRQRTVGDILSALPTAQARQLAKAFWLEAPDLAPWNDSRFHALLLTQPLDKIGICDLAEKARIYNEMAAPLLAQGWHLCVKHHPMDQPFDIAGAALTLPQHFPIEAWHAIAPRRFDLAVALCSASLTDGAGLFCRHRIQLVGPTAFNRARFGDWQHGLGASLETALTTTDLTGPSA